MLLKELEIENVISKKIHFFSIRSIMKYVIKNMEKENCIDKVSAKRVGETKSNAR